MTKQTEALKLALEALKKCHYYMIDAGLPNQSLLNVVCTASSALKSALAEQPAQQQQEPIGYLFQHEETGLTTVVDVQQVEWGFEKNNPRHQKIGPVYTSPPAQPAQQEEPKCGAIIEVFDKDWRLDYMSLPVGKHKLYTQQYTYTSPQQRKPLTDEEKLMCWSRATYDADIEHKTEHQCLMEYGTEIEAAHGIKENT